MGKIRIKTLGVEDQEEKQKKEAKRRKEEKKMAKGAHGGERVVSMEPSEEELAKIQVTEPKAAPKTPEKGKAKKEKFAKQRTRGKKYQLAAQIVDKNKIYGLDEALSILPKAKISKLDETVELHINTLEPGISATVTLPHGTGKKTVVAVADDKLISEIEKGKINFDILVAEPQMMAKLAKVAKILGPKGLMPNPKNGTVNQNPQDVVKKFEGGQIRVKTEAKAPIIHATVGKISFGDKKLEENIKTLISGIGQSKIKKIVLKSTMSPGIKIDTATV